MLSKQKLNEYFACYDYGMGGVWYRMAAPSAQAVREAFPEFVVFETEPDWMKTHPKNGVPVHLVGEPLDDVLTSIRKENSNN